MVALKPIAVFIVCLLASLFPVLSNISPAVASPADWVEVTRFTGSGTQNYTSDYFTCTHAEWRIQWSYVSDPAYPLYAILVVTTYPQGGDVAFNLIMESGPSNTSGTSYIHNRQGTFYNKIYVTYTQSYTIIIEQDIDSVPEFSSIISLSLSLILASLVVTIYRKRRAI
jgi:hypothetical protein